MIGGHQSNQDVLQHDHLRTEKREVDDMLDASRSSVSAKCSQRQD